MMGKRASSGRPPHRPSTYRPEYCERATEYLAKGHSLTAFAGNIGVVLASVSNWMERYPDFKTAVHIGLQKGAETWENLLLNTAVKNRGNVAAAIFGLKNRGATEWRDRVEYQGGISLELTDARKKLVEQVAAVERGAKQIELKPEPSSDQAKPE